MKKIFFLIAILAVPFFSLAQDAPEATEPIEKEEFEVRGWMPVGEMAREIMEATNKSNEAKKKMSDSVSELIGIAREMAQAVSSCQNIEACQSSCQEIYSDDGNCSCQGSICQPEFLCDMEKINSVLEKFNGVNETFYSGVNNYLDIIAGEKDTPNYLKDMYGGKFTELPKSHVYTDYNQFYNDFNTTISPILAKLSRNISLPLSDSSAKIPLIEYIKRQSDYIRIGFMNCQTPVGAQEDMENIADGKDLYKYPYRVDFILQNKINVPVDANESNLNYYCASTRGLYSPQSK
ncbi:MAG TPA: hypothetical protein PLA41_00615 [Candidatus Pacearchaeota archaeon]|nr:hypothetical protein [Candidatus Parcubacteria bacterium]HOU45640.1 hypothetical protein [Candidatus Pacearchaeota archaeon]HPM08298.1 hypothetical protein [Candidatus Pacearchaeota archaeon]HQI74569.1 hypothetical protein [Candidatus Pacearchaeota archaeon]